MAYMIRVTLEPCYIAAGSNSALLGQQQSNEPGYGSAQSPGPVPVAQTMMLMVNETVPGGESPSSGNFTTALTAAATDLGTMLTTAGSVPGFTSGTPLALIQGWATANP